MPPLHGRNLTRVKQQNASSIKTLLYQHGPLSRAEIAERLELTPPTITNIVAEMIQQGIVQELPPSKDVGYHSVGRKPIDVDFVLTARLALGISLGRDITHYCLTDLRGGILEQGCAPVMSERYDEMMAQLIELITRLRSQHIAEWQNVVGIGLVVPGLVDPVAGIVKNHGTERQDWCNKPLTADLSEATGMPICLENNVRGRAFALPLFRPQLVHNQSNFAFCHVSWGIACPVMLSGYMTIGEIGHTIIDPAGPQIRNCGKAGSLESYASLRAILERCRQALYRHEAPVLASLCRDPERLTLEQVLEAQEQQDPAVCAIVNLAMRYVGIALANIVNMLNPRLIFLSGPLFHKEENLQVVDEALHSFAFRAYDADIKLVHTDLGEYGGSVAAAAVCLKTFFIEQM